MLRFAVNFIERLEEAGAQIIATIRRIKADVYAEMSEFDLDLVRTHDVEFEPITAISSDSTVRAPAAASKSKPANPDYSKMSLAKLRNAYVEMFDEQPDKRLREKSLREYLEGAE